FESLTPRDIEVQDKHGHWWSVRIRPYKTTDHKIDGAVIALLDIDALKHSLRVQDGYGFAEALVSTAREPMLLLDGEHVVKFASPSFYAMFKLASENVLRKRIYDLDDPEWNASQLRVCLDTLKRESNIQNFELEYHAPDSGKKKLWLN